MTSLKSRRTIARIRACMLTCAAMLGPGLVHAAHPLQTEDSSTQGTGNLEIENGLSLERAMGSRQFVYQPQFSFGLTPTFDLMIQPSWLDNQDHPDTRRTGNGGTNVDFKWRFLDSDPWALGTRLGVQLPGGRADDPRHRHHLGMHALVVATLDMGALVAHGNLGWTQWNAADSDRRQVRHASMALMWTLDDKLIVTLDAGLDQASSKSDRRWPATALLGLVYTARPGLDLDIGLQRGTNQGSASRRLLMGLTYRFAP